MATVRRNEALLQAVPAAGLVILRDGDPGEPDVTLNQRSEFYSHRVEIRHSSRQPGAAAARRARDALLTDIGAATGRRS